VTTVAAAAATDWHPRPHLVRERWQSLDGTWSFAFDPRGVGEHEEWFLPGRAWPLRIEVPFPWESPRSGVGPPAPERYLRGETGWRSGTGWYARHVRVPGAWAGERVWLVVGAAYWETTVWVAGQRVCHHEGGYDPFDVDISDHLGSGEAAEVVLRVWAPEDTDEYPHGKNTRHWYSRASGIWQSVFMEPRSGTHVAALRVRTERSSGEVEATATLRSASVAATSARLLVSRSGRPVAYGEGRRDAQLGASTHTVRATVPRPEPWSCSSPTLYDIRVDVTSEDGSHDVVTTTAGFRDLAFAPLRDGGPRWFHLNGEPQYLRAVMSQGYHPQGILAYPDAAAI
jgi:beta-galactosidase/beta-glucuronidase